MSFWSTAQILSAVNPVERRTSSGRISEQTHIASPVLKNGHPRLSETPGEQPSTRSAPPGEKLRRQRRPRPGPALPPAGARLLPARPQRGPEGGRRAGPDPAPSWAPLTLRDGDGLEAVQLPQQAAPLGGVQAVDEVAGPLRRVQCLHRLLLGVRAQRPPGRRSPSRQQPVGAAPQRAQAAAAAAARRAPQRAQAGGGGGGCGGAPRPPQQQRCPAEPRRHGAGEGAALGPPQTPAADSGAGERTRRSGPGKRPSHRPAAAPASGGGAAPRPASPRPALRDASAAREPAAAAGARLRGRAPAGRPRARAGQCRAAARPPSPPQGRRAFGRPSGLGWVRRGWPLVCKEKPPCRGRAVL